MTTLEQIFLNMQFLFELRYPEEDTPYELIMFSVKIWLQQNPPKKGTFAINYYKKLLKKLEAEQK